MKVVSTHAQKMSIKTVISHNKRVLLTKITKENQMPSPMEKEEKEPADPWTYLPGDDVLPNVFSTQTMIIIGTLLVGGFMMLRQSEKEAMFKSLQDRGLLTIIVDGYRTALWYFFLYTIPSLIVAVFGLYVEKTEFYLKNKSGLQHELYLPENKHLLNKLAFIFIRRLMAVGFIWPYSIFGYAYKFVFIQFFLQFFYEFMKA